MIPKIKQPGDAGIRTTRQVKTFQIEKNMIFGNIKPQKEQSYKDVRSVLINSLQREYSWKKK